MSTMRWLRRSLVSLLLLAVFVAVGFVWLAGPMVTGFFAKNLCSGTFVAQRSPQAVVDEDLRTYSPRPLFDMVHWRVDDDTREVHASMPLRGRATARFVPGAGCTLRPDARNTGGASVATTAVSPATIAAGAALWPQGDRVAPPSPDSGVDLPRMAAALDAGMAEVESGNRRTRAIVIVHRGRIVAERYAAGFDANMPLPGWSMAKSVTAAIVGRLIAEGRLTALSEPLALPQWRGAVDGRSAITFEQALGMTSGLGFSEDYASPISHVNRMLFVERSAGAVALNVAMDAQPGTRWHYNSGTTNLISLALRERLGDAYHDAPRRLIFEPLGMKSAVFERDPAGLYVGSSFLYATARDWARFGLLYANGGRADGRQLLDPAFVTATAQRRADGSRYGLHWWLHEPSDESDLPAGAFQATGHAGQCLTVIPSHALVIVRLGQTQDKRVLGHARLIRDVMAAVAPTANR
jgi:hypothetical protein